MVDRKGKLGNRARVIRMTVGSLTGQNHPPQHTPQPGAWKKEAVSTQIILLIDRKIRNWE